MYSNSPQICFQNAGCSRWSLECGVGSFCCQVMLSGATEILFIVQFPHQNTQDRVFLTSLLKTSQSDRWLSFCIADCYPGASSDCWSFLESCASIAAWASRVTRFRGKLGVTEEKMLLRAFQEGHEDVGSKKILFFFFLIFSPIPRNGQCRLWLGEEITGEEALSSVKCSTDSCQLGANYTVFTHHQGQELSKETFYPVVQL